MLAYDRDVLAFLAHATPVTRAPFRVLLRCGLIGCLVASLTAGCTIGTDRPGAAVTGSTSGSAQATPSQPPDPAKVQANELGVVPVLMYHQITPTPESVYGRTPSAFRAELQRLASEGYVPVTAREYVTGNISIPAGKHPVVLTFDDSATSQFLLTRDGRPEPNTAVAILLDVARSNPGFRPVATMYVNGQPFADDIGRRELRWLHRHGFEVGNHTINHANLRKASTTEVQHQIAACQKMITEAVPGAEVATLALPFGVQPDKPELALRGNHQGTRYSYRGAFLVGAGPAPSPHNAEFEPAAIPRIRSQGSSGSGADFGSTTWLDYLAEHPKKRYTSDGDPQHVSFPQEVAGELTEGVPKKRAQPYQPNV